MTGIGPRGQPAAHVVGSNPLAPVRIRELRGLAERVALVGDGDRGLGQRDSLYEASGISIDHRLPPERIGRSDDPPHGVVVARRYVLKRALDPRDTAHRIGGELGQIPAGVGEGGEHPFGVVGERARRAGRIDNRREAAHEIVGQGGDVSVRVGARGEPPERVVAERRRTGGDRHAGDAVVGVVDELGEEGPVGFLQSRVGIVQQATRVPVLVR